VKKGFKGAFSNKRLTSPQRDMIVDDNKHINVIYKQCTTCQLHGRRLLALGML